MIRNKLVTYKAQGGAWDLPRPIQSEHRCKHCFSLSLCAVVHRTLEGGTAESFGLDVFDSLTAHLDDKDAAFLKTWLELLELERAEAKQKHPQENIWALDPPPHTRAVQQPHLPSSRPVQGCTELATTPAQTEQCDPDDDCENACPNSQQSPSEGSAALASETPQRKVAVTPQPHPPTAPAYAAAAATPEGETLDPASSALPAPVIPPAPLSAPTLQHTSKSGVSYVKHALQGRCIGHLQLQSYLGQADNSPLYPHKYTFTQNHSTSCGPAAGATGGTAPAQVASVGVACASHAFEMIPLSSQGFSAGDCGILSLQGRHVAVNRAQVESVSDSVLTVLLRSRLSLSFEQGCMSKPSTGCAENTVDKSRCCSAAATGASTAAVSDRPRSTCLWRIDKDEPETAFQIAVSGVLELVVSMTLHTTRLRRLLVHFEPPTKEARANYDAEVPPDIDHVEAMVEFECASLHPNDYFLCCGIHALFHHLQSLSASATLSAITDAYSAHAGSSRLFHRRCRTSRCLVHSIRSTFRTPSAHLRPPTQDNTWFIILPWGCKAGTQLPLLCTLTCLTARAPHRTPRNGR